MLSNQPLSNSEMQMINPGQANTSGTIINSNAQIRSTPTRSKSNIPKSHPVNVYLDPKYKLNTSLTALNKNQKKNSVTKVSDLRNPFKKWKPSVINRQTSKVLKAYHFNERYQGYEQTNHISNSMTGLNNINIASGTTNLT